MDISHNLSLYSTWLEQVVTAWQGRMELSFPCGIFLGYVFLSNTPISLFPAKQAHLQAHTIKFYWESESLKNDESYLISRQLEVEFDRSEKLESQQESSSQKLFE